MTRLVWDQGARPYDEGIDQCVLYLENVGIAWSGVMSVVENPDDPISDSIYLDGRKQHKATMTEDFSVTVLAFTYPEEFDNFYDDQPRKLFDFSYRTKHGDNYKIHLVYNALAKPSEIGYKSISNSTAPTIFAWELMTTPVKFEGIRPTAHFIIDPSVFPAEAFSAIEDTLYGSSTTDATLPSIGDILELILTETTLRIYDNGDGTWTAVGPDSAIVMVSSTEFTITWSTAVYIDGISYTLSNG
jgi:hypothetical protein